MSTACATSLGIVLALALPTWVSAQAGEAGKGEPKATAKKGQDGQKPEKKRKPRFTIGKQTTYITEPLDKDGYPDYVAALNERLKKGVTPKNNAVVLLVEAFGPKPEGGRMSAEFYRWLGTKEPPDPGDYLRSGFAYMRIHYNLPGAQIEAQMDVIAGQPWTAKQFPHFAKWLKENERPLALVIEASKRERYFLPLIPIQTEKERDGLIGALIPHVQRTRELANTLVTRAMLHIGEKRYDEAWQDLLTLHRVARLQSQGGTLIEGLVGVAIDSIASEADLMFLESAKLDAKKIIACLRDLQQLPPIAEMTSKVDLCDRFIFLDSTVRIERHGALDLQRLARLAPNGAAPDPKLQELIKVIDWDAALRKGNRWYDRVLVGMREKDRAARRKRIERIDLEMKELAAKVSDKEAVLAMINDSRDKRAAAGEWMGDVVISLLMPAVWKVQDAGFRVEQIQRNLHVAFALAAYQRDHGRYPMKLEMLAPKYLAKVPDDLFSGKALIYRPSKNGYLLYSVGVNGEDEAGRWYDDDPPGDDPRVKMPLPKPRRE